VRNSLRMWAAQSCVWGQIWRITKGAQGIGASYREGLNAFEVPRLLYWQLDVIMEDYICKLEKLVLKDLERHVFPSKGAYREQSTWFTVVLSSIIYLAVLESDTWNLESWKAKCKEWESNPLYMGNPVSFKNES
jgi:hypothetical protein